MYFLKRTEQMCLNKLTDFAKKYCWIWLIFDRFYLPKQNFGKPKQSTKGETKNKFDFNQLQSNILILK